tara:strand:+ start:1998 stop:6254 length:4257 start_codon:yes stop_codon:yes gene_type:complete
MSQFIDFVGLNTFIYEANGYIPERISSNGAFLEYVTGDGIAYKFGSLSTQLGYAATINNHIGSYGFSQPNTYPSGNTTTQIFQYIDINQLQNHKFPLFLSASLVPGIPSSASYFPALMLKRNGPYGHPMFKQIRVHENPLTRRQRKENIFTIVEMPSDEIIKTFGSNRQTKIIRSRYGNIIGYREAPLTSKYKPLDWLVGLSPDNERIDNQTELTVDNIERVVMRNSFGNDINFFANTDLNNRLGLEVLKDEDYEKITNLYLDGGLDSDGSPISTFEFLKYSETIFPRETNAYRKIARKRFNFVNGFWRDARSDRSVIPTNIFDFKFEVRTNTALGSTHLPSIWPLDADVEFATKTRSTISAFSVAYLGSRQTDDGAGTSPNYISGGAGILQNQYSHFSPVALTNQLYVGSLMKSAPVYNRRHGMGDISSATNQRLVTSSVVAPDGIVIPETGSSYLGGVGVGAPFQGQALWEAGVQSGKNPFDSSYGVWYENLRLKAKDYSVVPEFTISSFVPTIEVSGALKFIDNMFEVTGGSSGETNAFDPTAVFFGNDSSEAKFYETYSTSDFMKHFAKIKKDHTNFVEPSKITLTCKAFKKFLAYDSFYPALRTVDIAQQFSSSYSEYITATSSLNPVPGIDNPSYIHAQKLQNLLVPLLSPGILFNSIKAGVACDYPLMTGSLATRTNTAFGAYTVISGAFYDTRIPFEALYQPEAYLSNTDLICNEPSSFANTKINSVWTGQGDNLYKKMMNNFLAETVEFFLEDSSLTSIVSAKQSNSKFGNAVAGKSYGMRVKLGKTLDGNKALFAGEKGNYSPPNTYITGGALAVDITSPRENITMYSRPSAFGPPTDGFGSKTEQNATNGSIGGQYFPYTPPYYDGEAWCDIIFTAAETKKYTLREIIDSSQYRLIRVDPMSAGSSSVFINTMELLEETQAGMQATKFTRQFGNDASFFIDSKDIGLFTDSDLDYKHLHSPININAMNINSSVNLAGQGVLDGGNVRLTSFSDGDPDARWVIQTKFECPILNFKDVDVTINTTEKGGNSQTPRGMWHQYGSIPADDESIFLEIENIPRNWNYNYYDLDKTETQNTGSLMKLCGFSTERKRLGAIADKKIIKEAVVAVPYTEVDGTKRFYSIGKDQVFNAKKFLESRRFETEGGRIAGSFASSDFYRGKTVDTIINTVIAMDEYVFPPTMDFVHFDDKVDPFAMYIFEFSHTLDQDDIKDIWQNLPPKIAESFEESQSTIEHPLFAKQFLSTFDAEEIGNPPTGGVLNEKIRWMVFKVKQRASKQYAAQDVTQRISRSESKRNRLFPNKAAQKAEAIENLLSYNWPYDFFSLVELVKIDSEITFSDVSSDNPNAPAPKGSPKKDKSERTMQRNPTRSDAPSAQATPPTLPMAQAAEGTPAQGQASLPEGAGPDSGRSR